MKNLIDFIKEKCTQKEIQELVKELVPTELHSVPRSWEEYCKTLKGGYYIEMESKIAPVNYDDYPAYPDNSKNVLPTYVLTEAFLAMMQLMSLRQAWIKSWKPDWNAETIYKYCIVFVENSPKVDKFCYNHKVLSFPFQEMAEDFLECFGDLIEKAKVLI